MYKNFKVIIKNSWKDEITRFLINELANYLKDNKLAYRIILDKDLLQYLLPNLLQVKCVDTYLKYIDFRDISFDGIDITLHDFEGTNINIDPQKVKNKSLYGINLKGIDLSGKDFTDVNIEYTNLEETKANINPQKLISKSLLGTNLKGIDLSNADFTGVDIREANLEETKANIDPQTVYEKDLYQTNLKNLDMSNKYFKDVKIKSTILEGTKANIDPQTVYEKDSYQTNLRGLDLSDKNFDDVLISWANLENTYEALSLIREAITNAGYKEGADVNMALDVAASEFYQDGLYKFEGKNLTSEDMVNYYEQLINDFPVISIEDGLAEDDYDGWAMLTSKLGKKINLVGDDLFVTNKKLLQYGIDNKIANSILIKLNQIGTVTETLETIELAKQNNYKTIISHRSGETEDTTIADIAVGLDLGRIKTGSISRGERICKYNRLIRIEEKINNK